MVTKKQKKTLGLSRLEISMQKKRKYPVGAVGGKKEFKKKSGKEFKGGKKNAEKK